MTNFIKNVKSASALMRELFAKTPIADKIERLQLTPADVFLKRPSLINKKVC